MIIIMSSRLFVMMTHFLARVFLLFQEVSHLFFIDKIVIFGNKYHPIESYHSKDSHGL